MSALPDHVETVEDLDDLLSRPSPALVEDLARVEGDILVLGASGKVGPTLARMAKRAAPEKGIVAVARFSDSAVRRRLDAWDIETIGCDLFDRNAVARLPRLPNIVFMVGRKFGTTGHEGLTWASNVHLPGIVAETFTDARIVAFSTLCVYPFADVTGPGWDETAPVGTVGEYANSCVGRSTKWSRGPPTGSSAICPITGNLPAAKFATGVSKGGDYRLNAKSIDFIVNEVSDVGKSVAFYRDILGLDFQYFNDEADWSECLVGETTIALCGPGAAKWGAPRKTTPPPWTSKEKPPSPWPSTTSKQRWRNCARKKCPSPSISKTVASVTSPC
jgi:hypothetical protein